MALEIDLSDQVVVVTGGTAGIGRATVEVMLEAGARVAFCAVDQADCDAAAAELGRRFAPDRVLGLAADLNARETLTAFADRATALWGRIDTLVCNATDFGVGGPPTAVDPERYLQLLQANVVNNMHLCTHVLPRMEARRTGSVILITSIAGFTTMPSNIPYASSKAAIMSMARSLAAQYADSGVRVNCVSPGLIRTAGARSIWDSPDEGRAYIQRNIPMNRIGLPEEIAAACAFLASPLAAYITAAVLPVDGGRVGIGQKAG